MATLCFIERLRPDIVIFATGAKPSIPDFTQTQMSGVFTAEEVLTEAKEAGGKVIACGLGLVGCDVASFWLKKTGT
jgi:pyruvate/2-oxoglutarate dehydrogenase complex dihydrolipoamide dehydrogenase (E3) component